ncbi:hypothetical protein [Vibrio parahaemolyticus]|uniref:hypothetical protein n=1 Tax=Vibrio parahaemolyticus TaxID=670 RepID=UPI00111DAEB4|nr:hypothetical protein [Vibrio parahaemolyticus]EIV1709680.1 hypothetical protein [Vibrio parahaemolyticus]EJE4706447.1 hypothetical protein [Vibrio parahaemolyticus]ELI5436103.1 hypothetical protein [Vibrio parahaemolyticus]TOA43614.1 hypothetical protein CGK27_23565 [Vibrio parahaemolyticus]TOA94312.1 hypothetical protein CGK15_23885 [Vibrio parahaemolyticus]
MKKIVTLEELEAAKTEWITARDRAINEHQAWATVIKSKTEIINDFQLNGQNISRAQASFAGLTNGHSDSYRKALQDLDRKSKYLGQLLKLYEEQEK